MREHSRTPIEQTREKYDLTDVGILRYKTALLTLLAAVGVLASILLYVTISRSEQVRTRISFENAAKARITSLREHVRENLNVLDWVASFHVSSQQVERSEFQEFTRQYFRKHHEIRALQWIPRVRDADRDAYEAAARKDGFPDFQFTEGQNPEHLVRAARREEYYPAYFVEPHKGNEAVLGFDLGTNSVWLEALKWARDNNRATATEPLIPTQEGGDSIFVFKPVYVNESQIDSVEERRENLKGFVLAVLKTDSFLDHILTHLKPFGMDIHLCDPSAPKGQCSRGSHLSRTPSGIDKTSVEFCDTLRLLDINSLHMTGTLEVADKRWTVLCVPAPASFAGGRTLAPWTAMISGLAFTVLLTLLSLAVLQRVARSREFTEQLLRSQQELRCEIADREETEHALRESEKRFSLAIEGSNDGIWDWPDIDDDSQWWSAQCYELLGYEDGEIEASHSNFLHLLHQDDLEKTQEVIRAHFQERAPMDVEYRLRTKSGEYRWFRGRAQAVWNENGKARRMSGSISDITRQKKAEERILREKMFSENLIDSSVDGILAYDNECRCTIWNPGMEHISGISREEALGECVFDVFPFLKKAEENKFFYEALAGRTVVAMDRPYLVPENGQTRFLRGLLQSPV